MGQTTPAGVDGAIIQGPNFPTPVAPFTASVQNGTFSAKAHIAYLGPLPGFIAGAMQVNIQIPDTVPSGKSTLVVSSPVYGGGMKPQNIYMLTDPPTLSSVSPASPISQTLGIGTTLILTGTSLSNIVAANFYFNGQPFKFQQQPFLYSNTSTSYTVGVYFGGKAGDFAVEVVNAANQVSNRLVFTVLPLGPPTVTGILSYITSKAPVATKGIQFLSVTGTNFQTPLSADIFYSGNRIATLSSSAALQITVYRPDLFQMEFDFQGNAGAYGVEVVGPDGSRSTRFDFMVAAP
jgi:hypothetical protein